MHRDRGWLVAIAVLWRRRSVAKSSLRLHLAGPSTLQCHSLCPDQRILDRLNDFMGEDWPRIHRPRNGFFPSLDDSFHVASRRLVHQGVGFHESAVEIALEVDVVWSPHVFDDAVEHIEGDELLRR